MKIFAKPVCFLFFCGMSFLSFCEPPVEDWSSPVELSRGVSIGNALEAPKGDFWGVEMKKEYFDLIKEAGFDSVRIPIRFSDYNDRRSGKIQERFLKSVDGYIRYGLSRGLNIILDLHHFTELMKAPEDNKTRLISIWRQLSERYMDYPPKLIFEILNEPQKNLKVKLWNEYLSEVISVIRETNPERLIVVGGTPYNTIEGLEAIKLPRDGNLMATFHYYHPPEFAFQGNEHHKGFESLGDVKWTGSDDEISRIRKDFQRVRDWSRRNRVKVFLGEFGCVKTIPSEYRCLWTSNVASIAEEMGFSWCYWELCSWFGILDPDSETWDAEMLQSLFGERVPDGEQ